jgi:hypothetical protein
MLELLFGVAELLLVLNVHTKSFPPAGGRGLAGYFTQIIQARLIHPSVTFFGVVAVAGFELLEEADHAGATEFAAEGS